MTCCKNYEGCEPGTGRAVDVIVDYTLSTKTAFYSDTLAAYPGDIEALVKCRGLTDRFDADYCGFNIAEGIAPRIADCDGEMTVDVVTSSAPVGGAEVFDVLINGLVVGQVELLAGNLVGTEGPWPVGAGDIITVVMSSTTALQPSGLGSVRFLNVCDDSSSGPVLPPDPLVCAIGVQPSNASGEVGTAINVSGSVTSGGEQWQESTSATGPTWVDVTRPATVTQLGSVWYRLCCASDPTVCSNPIEVIGLQDNLFDPTSPTGSITTQGNNITDELGNRIGGGGINAAINQRTSNS